MTSWKDAVTRSPEGVLLRLHTVPGSSAAVFPAGYNEWRRCFEIKVKGEARENKANSDVVDVVSGFFHLPSRAVRVVDGMKSREKTILLTGVSLEKVFGVLEDFFRAG
jgi:uncharacterized protein (TIGR00251 family)